jgi:hypothetical protein
MTEKLLHFIWQFQYFNKNELFTEAGEPLQIIKQGFYNTNQGPDFLEASIKVDSIVLVGNIELHINASDWHKHQHAEDKNYNNTILHVVWYNDKPVLDKFGKQLPTLVLQHRVPKVMLLRYEELMNAGSGVLCKKFLPVLVKLAGILGRKGWWQNALKKNQRKCCSCTKKATITGKKPSGGCWLPILASR